MQWNSKNHMYEYNILNIKYNCYWQYLLSFLLQRRRRKWRSATIRTRRRSRWRLENLVVWNVWYDLRNLQPRLPGIVETFRSKGVKRRLHRFPSRVVSEFIVYSYSFNCWNLEFLRNISLNDSMRNVYVNQQILIY